MHSYKRGGKLKLCAVMCAIVEKKEHFSLHYFIYLVIFTSEICAITKPDKSTAREMYTTPFSNQHISPFLC